MVRISQAKGPATYRPVNESGERYIGSLFGTGELNRASQIVKALEGMTIQEADDLLDRVKCYLTQSVFTPNLG